MKQILITGAAGSLGKVLVDKYLRNGYTVRAYDNNEAALAQLKTNFPDIRAVYGSITDHNRLEQAMVDVDLVVSAAAMKNLVITEDNPKETIETNIIGTYNVATAAKLQKVKKAIIISSDKAVESVSLYGHTKLVGESLWLWSNRHSQDTMFSIIRSGNFRESQGNVFEVWDRQIKCGPYITLTDPQMERYFISMDDITKFVILVEELMQGGEIFIPKMELCNIHDFAKEYAHEHGCGIEIVGARAGEKLIEKLYTQEESTRIKDHEDYMVIM